MKKIETSPEEAEMNMNYRLCLNIVSIDKKSNVKFEKNKEKFYGAVIDTFCKRNEE